MSQSLSDDLADWPSDPYEILGVANTTAQRQVRKSYAQLIRRFRPESHPQHYQRIRAAYDFVMAWAPEVETEASPPEPAPVITREAPVQPLSETLEVVAPADVVREDLQPDQPVAQHSQQESPTEPPPDSDTAPDPVDLSNLSLDGAWELACQGDTRTAYRVLTRHARKSHGNGDAALRLYWLLRLEPRLDARLPATWLLSGLAQSGFASPLLTAYVQELERHPASVNIPGEGRLLDADAPPERLLTALAARLRAAARVGIWSIIELDLAILRSRWREAHAESWATALNLACHRLGFSEAPEASVLFNSCRTELNSANVAASAPPDPRLILLDQLREVARRRIPTELQRLYLPDIKATWNERNIQAEQRLLANLRSWRYRPGDKLRILDAMHTDSPALLQAFAAVVAQFEGIPHRVPFTPEWALIAKCLRLTIDTSRGRDYETFRAAAIQASATHLLSRDEILQWVELEPPDSAFRKLADPLRADAPFACYAHGVQAFAVRMGGGQPPP